MSADTSRDQPRAADLVLAAESLVEAGDPMRRLQLLNTKPDPGTMAGGDTEAGSVPGSVGGWSTVYLHPAQSQYNHADR